MLGWSGLVVLGGFCFVFVCLFFSIYGRKVLVEVMVLFFICGEDGSFILLRIRVRDFLVLFGLFVYLAIFCMGISLYLIFRIRVVSICDIICELLGGISRLVRWGRGRFVVWLVGLDC